MAQLPLYAFAFVYIGRLQELITALEPLRIVLILTVLATVSVIFLPREQKHAIWREREVRLVLLLGGLAVVLMPFSVWPGLTYGFITGHFARVILLFLLIAAVATSPRIATGLVLSLLTAITVLSVFTLRGASVLAGSGRAFASDMYDPNELAMVIDCALPFAVLGAFSLRGVGRFVAVISTALGVATVVKTISRGGFIGLVVVGILLVLRWRSVSMVRRVAVLLAGVLILWIALPPSYWSTIGTLLNFHASDTDDYLESGIRGRTDIWEQGLSVFRQSPLLGVGAGAFQIADGLSHGGVGKWSTAHNSFIQIAGELGIVGLAIFVTMMVISIRNARVVARLARTHAAFTPLEWIATAAEMSLYTYIVVGFALSQAYSSLLYLLFGLATALRLQTQRQSLPETPKVPTTRQVRSPSA